MMRVSYRRVGTLSSLLLAVTLLALFAQLGAAAATTTHRVNPQKAAVRHHATVRTHTTKPHPVPSTSAPQPSPSPSSSFTVSDEASLGRVVVENSLLRIVFGYSPTRAAYNNRSGGSIYGLYDRLTDPACSHNLVQLISWGSGSSTPSHAGIGGLGATKAYLDNSSKAISEVGTYARPLAKSVTILADGRVKAVFSYVVRDWNGLERYRLDKTWTVSPTGGITLSATWLWLVPSLVNDPNYDFAFSRDYGWTRIGWFTHKWTGALCGGSGSAGFTDPDNAWIYDPTLATEGDCDYGTYHVQQYRFDRAPSGTVLTVAINPDGGGYESSGLFRFGYDTWYPADGANAIHEITGEFSNYRTAAYGHEVRWGSWFSDDGGRLTTNGISRFKPIPAGTTWTDTFAITVSH
jgi:hypothetical protein